MRKAKPLFVASLFLLMLIPSGANAQEPYSDHAVGLQIGYSRLGYNQLEFGLNYYWSYTGDLTPDDSLMTRSHTFGPSLSAAFMFKEGSGFVRQ